ncbi:MAG: radical SAM family heme chaperone HemW [Bacteroidia bacterium]|nr:radical SAM family heme chaperone HemW [Bacteroidia bacterium]
MPGIYIHIPFCKQACNYCNFHFSTSPKLKDDFLVALNKEIELRKAYLGQEKVNTIYFGGGTPSVLSANEISSIIYQVSKFYEIDKEAEITLEANPDDLSMDYLNGLSQTPINRLSIGVQSFHDKDLQFMNRVHSSKEAVSCIENAKKAGFDNINMDLIYGVQTLTDDCWKKNLEKFSELDVPHLSAYSLTVEPKTQLSHDIKKGLVKAVDDERPARHFEILMNTLEDLGFIHYEISNFCKEGFISQHNSNYWKQKKYLGLGPSAHSYNGESRQWNIANNAKYVSTFLSETRSCEPEHETLTTEQKYNEYILTSLRTIWGIDTEKLQQEFGEEKFNNFIAGSHQYLDKNYLVEERGVYKLTRQGKLFADSITADLFI